MKKPKFLTFIGFVLIILTNDLLSQHSILGIINQHNSDPLAYASVVLKTHQNKQFVAGNISDDNGGYTFEYIKNGLYDIEISMVGFETQNIEKIEVKDQNVTMPPIIMLESTQIMDEIQIKARKVMYERKIDRLVVNVQSSAMAAGSSALDIIERSPGMVVNRQSGIISMAGRDGVIVMINGKRQFISEDALIGLLSGINANNIDKLEIITTPPSNLDAEGNAGYINIILIKNENEGYNVNYGVAAGGYRGFIGNANANLSLNYGKWSASIDVSGNRNEQKQSFNFEKTTYIKAVGTNTYTANSRSPVREVGTLRVGTTYRFGKSSVTFGANGYFNNWKMLSAGDAVIRKDNVYNNTIMSTQDEKNNWQHGGISVGFNHSFANKSSLSYSGDLLSYLTENPTEYSNKYAKIIEENDIPAQSKSYKSTPIDIYVNALDYTYKIGKLNAESGVKMTNSKFTNDVFVDYLENNNWIRQGQFSNYSRLSEDIYAAYTSIGGNISSKTSFKAGLRFEESITTIKDERDSIVVNRDLPYLFPSIFLTHSISEHSGLSVSLSRRITRPTFNDLAPFVFFTDPTSLVTGDPSLLSVLSNAFNAEYKYKSKVLSVQYAIDQNPIARFVPTVMGTGNTTIAKVRNFDKFRTISSSLSIPFSLAKWWDVNTNLTGFIQTIYGDYEGTNIEIVRPSANLFLTNTITLPKSMTFEIGGFINSGGFFGPFQNKPFGSLNTALVKKYKSMFFSIGVDNLLNSMHFRSSFTDSGSGNTFSNDMIFAQTNIKCVFRHNFGNTKVKSNTKSSANDERRRVE
jgi:hypothetical protein